MMTYEETDMEVVPEPSKSPLPPPHSAASAFVAKKKVVYSSSIKRYIKRYMQYLGVAANDFNMSDIHARIGKDTRQM